jgi:hypothetical protein
MEFRNQAADDSACRFYMRQSAYVRKQKHEGKPADMMPMWGNVP